MILTPRAVAIRHFHLFCLDRPIWVQPIVIALSVQTETIA